MQRLIYTVNGPISPLPCYSKWLMTVQGLTTTASVRVGLDLGIFNKLVDVKGSLTLTELSEATGADPVLLGKQLCCTVVRF